MPLRSPTGDLGASGGRFCGMIGRAYEMPMGAIGIGRAVGVRNGAFGIIARAIVGRFEFHTHNANSTSNAIATNIKIPATMIAG